MTEQLIVAGPEPHPSGLLCLLGPWRLAVDGRPVLLTPGAQRLTALVALRGPLTRAAAAAVLWPDVPVASAARRLREVLARTTRTCAKVVAAWGFPVAEVDGRLGLHPGVQVDVTALDALLKTTLETARETALETAMDSVVDVPAFRARAGEPSVGMLLDAEDLLTGWYDDWVIEERARVAVRRRRGLVALAARLLHAGDPRGALEAAARASVLDPTDENAAGTAIAAHLALGDEALAVRRFLELATVLRNELGIDPAAPLVELVRDRLSASHWVALTTASAAARHR